MVRAVNYVESIRKFGYMDARIDPLGSPAAGDPSLMMENHGITAVDLSDLPTEVVSGTIAAGKSSAL
jgi:2-oxoglutarate dehydrogenase complex dehydrogenase (E1) component-like enzyme